MRNFKNIPAHWQKIKKQIVSKDQSGKSKHKKIVYIVLIVCVLVILLFIIVFSLIDRHVKNSYADRIIDPDSVDTLKDFSADCILILGAGVTDAGSPMPMLLERLHTGLSLYQAGIAFKIIVSGDHGRVDYDEVNVMKDWLIEEGVPSEDIFMDHAGFSTYESMYRMRDVFQLKSMVVVTQKYHMYRSLYNANTLGIESVGVPCDEVRYSGQTYREIREMAARVKDFFFCLFDVKPKYLGDTISVSGSGNVTNDKE